MVISKNMKSKFVGILSLAILSFSFSSASPVSAGSGASATPSMTTQNGYLKGGLIVFGGSDFVPEISAYFELYRNGTFLGSKQDVSDNYYLSKSATAHITDGVHSESGTYLMKWSGRVKDYNFFGGDWTDSGEKSYYKS